MSTNQLKIKRTVIKRFDKENIGFLALYGIYNESIDPEITYEKFVEMYVSVDLLAIDFSCLYDDQKRAGFSAAFFYETMVSGKKAYIVRSATGLKKAYQGKGLHNKFDLYSKFIRFALKHPGRRIWACAFIINAFIFRDLCKFVPEIFPMPGKQIPDQVQQFIDALLASGEHLPHKLHPLSRQVPIQVKFNEDLLKRIFESKDRNVQWYLKANPGFLNKYGLLVVINISARNICGTIANFLIHSTSEKLTACGKIVESHGKNIKQKIAIFVKTITKRRIF